MKQRASLVLLLILLTNIAFAGEIHDAVSSHDIDEVRSLLKRNSALVFEINKKKETPLHIAASKGYAEIAKVLVENKADLNALDEYHNTPLHNAATGDTGSTEILQLLLENGAAANVVDRFGESPLFKAKDPSRIRGPEKVKLLLQYGAEYDKLHKAAHDLREASKDGKLETVKAVLKEFPGLVNGADVSSQSALFHAVKHNRVEVAGFLIENKADVNLSNTRWKEDSSRKWSFWVNDETPLHIAITNNNLSMTLMLLSAGADITIKNSNGKTARQFAEMANEIGSKLSKGLNTEKERLAQEIVDRIGKAIELLLILAEKIGGIEAADYWTVAEILTKNPEALNKTNEMGKTLLHMAAVKGRNFVASDLLRKGADVNARDNEGKTPLHCTASTELAESLISKNAEINAKDNSGQTPLHHAAFWGRTKIVELLISKGADINGVDKNGKTPLSYAEEKKHQEISDLLIKNGAKRTKTKSDKNQKVKSHNKSRK